MLLNILAIQYQADELDFSSLFYFLYEIIMHEEASMIL